MEFEQNRMVRTTRNFELFDNKQTKQNHFLYSVGAILETCSVAETIFDAKLLI